MQVATFCVVNDIPLNYGWEDVCVNHYIYLNRRASRRGLFNGRTSSCDHIINGVGFLCVVYSIWGPQIIYSENYFCGLSVFYRIFEERVLGFLFFIQKCQKSNKALVRKREKKKIKLRKFTWHKKTVFNMLRNFFLFSCQI